MTVCVHCMLLMCHQDFILRAWRRWHYSKCSVSHLTVGYRWSIQGNVGQTFWLPVDSQWLACRSCAALRWRESDWKGLVMLVCWNLICMWWETLWCYTLVKLNGYSFEIFEWVMQRSCCPTCSVFRGIATQSVILILLQGLVLDLERRWKNDIPFAILICEECYIIIELTTLMISFTIL